jgi:purine-cytosine permease-like protein
VLFFAAAALGVSLALGRWPLLRRVGLGLIILLAIAISASAYMEFEIPSYLRRPAAGGWPEFWQAVSVMLVFPLLWLPVAADHARGSLDRRGASLGTLLGLTLMATWFGVLGIVYLPATDSGDIPGFLVGMQLGLGAMIFLLVLQLDEVFVNTRSFEFVVSDLKHQVNLLTSALPLLVAIPAAIFLHVGDLEGYLLFTGALFVPAFGVVLAYSLRPIDQPLAFPLGAWLGGFVLYQWISPSDIGWWQDSLNWLTDQLGIAFPLSDEIGWLGAVIPSFLFAFAVQLVACATLPRSAGRSLTPAAG